MVDLSKTQKGGAAIAAAVLVAAPLAAQFEGYSAKVYKDPAGIPTYCYGETELARHDPSHIYAKSECMALLRARMARDYAPHLLQCVPGVRRYRPRFAFGALLDASYNAGWAAACKSRMAVSFRAGDWAQGCAGFKGWYVTARNRTTGQRIMLKGLVGAVTPKLRHARARCRRPSKPLRRLNRRLRPRRRRLPPRCLSRSRSPRCGSAWSTSSVSRRTSMKDGIILILLIVILLMALLGDQRAVLWPSSRTSAPSS
jgi:lysozyme